LGPTLERYGGEPVAASQDVRVEEGDWEHRGILVLIRFPTLESAVEWYHSTEYEPVLELRKASSHSRLMIFAGD
jgi:uncharacterized protein (DUF1330 family)